MSPPRLGGQATGETPCPPNCGWMTSSAKPNHARRQSASQQKQEAVALCLVEFLTGTAVAQRLGIPVS